MKFSMWQHSAVVIPWFSACFLPVFGFIDIYRQNSIFNDKHLIHLARDLIFFNALFALQIEHWNSCTVLGLARGHREHKNTTSGKTRLATKNSSIPMSVSESCSLQSQYFYTASGIIKTYRAVKIVDAKGNETYQKSKMTTTRQQDNHHFKDQAASPRQDKHVIIRTARDTKLDR